jgi:hypothetical protein
MPSYPLDSPLVDRRSFLARAALASGLLVLGPGRLIGQGVVGLQPPLGQGVGDPQPPLDQADIADARLVLTVRGRRYGVRLSDMRGGRHLVTLRALNGRERHAWSYPAGGRAAKGTLSFGDRSYSVAASGSGIRTDLPGVSVGPPEGSPPQTQMFRGILIGIAAVITAIVGGEVEIEGANGSKITIKSNGAGGSETASEEGGDGSSGGSGESSYRAEPGMEDDPGVWY